MRAAALQAELIAAAIAHAQAGRPVFPCAADKRPRVKSGFKAATTDCRILQEWWSRWPIAMIGMPTGAASGFDVLDIDRKAGKDGFATLRERGVTIPADAVEVITPSGGSHFYFPHEPGRRSEAERFGPGVDIRADGGYVIVPPSRPAIDGPDYHFAEGQSAECLGLPIGRLSP